MIAASEPWEFIPRGRQAVEEHPGPQFTKQQLNIPNEHLLLYRMQNVNISSDNDFHESWSIREIYKECMEDPQTVSDPKVSDPIDGKYSYITDTYVNSEDEIYFKKHTAVWTRGLQEDGSVLPMLSFTCDTPVRFAFFCDLSFVRPQGDTPVQKKSTQNEKDITTICIIDCTSLRIYCSDGEDYIANLDFPISNVRTTKYGLLFEKDAADTVIQNHSISMPRLFSLRHPLEEVRPVLNKTATGGISYLTESDFRVIYATPNSDLVLIYDNKMGKHFVSKLRKATQEEINFVGCGNDNNASTINQSHRTGCCSVSHNSLKMSGAAKNSTAILARSSLGTTGHATHISKFLNTTFPHSVSSPINISQRSNAPSPLSRLQSTMGCSHSVSVQNIRKIGQTPPPKPIVPDFCLDHVWTETAIGRDFSEVATNAFMHTDLVGQEYLCYILPRSGKLQLIRLDKTDGDIPVFGKTFSIPATDAVAIDKMKMIAVLAPCCSLILYSGPVLVSKVHVSRNISAPVYYDRVDKRKSLNSTFPRRSSLLPTAQQSESQFDDELHLLSPVHPLQPRSSNNPRGVGICVGLRDPAGNRLTLVYSGSRMFRISLPLISESIFITNCIKALREVLKKDLFIHLMVKWYAARNPPGSQDFSSEQEWEMFRNVLSEQIGRAISSNESTSNASFNAEEPKKRRKNSEMVSGTDEDWNYLQIVLQSSNTDSVKTHNVIKFNDSTAPLFAQIPLVFYILHLLYEDMKLKSSLNDERKRISEFLYQLALDMQLSAYCLHYIMDFPQLVHSQSTNFFTPEDGQKMEHKNILTQDVPSIFKQVDNIIQGKIVPKYSCISNVNIRSRNVLQLISLISQGHMKIKHWINDISFPGTSTSDSKTKPKRVISGSISRPEQLVQMLINMNMTRADIGMLPTAIHLIVAQCLEACRISPPIGSSPETYELILRSELVEHVKYQNNLDNFTVKITNSGMDAEDSLSNRYPLATYILKGETPNVEDDGMDNIDTKLLGLRFPDDLRIAEVRRLLNSSEPVLIDITQSPGVSDHEFIEEQEKQLYSMCTRTMTLPMGRGMFTFRTAVPIPTEYMPIPRLCLTGKEPIKGATIEMTQIEFPANMNTWPLFHNGVAAGLRISPSAKDIDSTWIVYNKPKGQSADVVTEHAGFLMALGLNGHLKNLSFMSMYEYLVKVDEMTSGGILLGIAATHRGTMDSVATKLLSVHVEALLPATALELDIPHNIQVASLMGIGLVYQGTANRHIAEILLQEIGRPPGPEMENSIERESFSLSAGLALGLVTLGQGESPAGLRDLQLPDTLHYYMVGGNKRLMTGSQKEKYKLPSFQVREGDMVNIDVTAPGATLALGLMFFNTSNRAISEWMMPPDTSYLLDLIRPDLLLLRVIAKGLIMWQHIKPTPEWLFGQFPVNLQFDTEIGPAGTEDIDDEANAQAYCNIIAGAAFCIGLKYAGTENRYAYRSIRKTIKLFLSAHTQYIGEYAGKATIESCLILCVVSLSLVFAGSGDLEILRIIRYLRSRIGSAHSQVTYGSQMGIHMALGFLFLGAGRYTISKSPEAVAALVCAIFPKFPNHSNDNRYHLQSFRHLYVLATEPRLFLPRDIDTKKLCLCKITCIELDGSEVDNLPMAPCMLPDLATLKKVIVNDANYWPVCFERGRNWEQLKKVLEYSSCVDIKRRAGCLSHLDDPDRLKSLLAQTLTTEQFSSWKIDTKTLLNFSTDARVVSFTWKFLNLENAAESAICQDELERSQLLIIFFYNCLRKDKMHALPIYLAILDILQSLTIHISSTDIWQIKIIETYMRSVSSNNDLISKEIVNSAIGKFKTYVKSWMDTYSKDLRTYITSNQIDFFKEMPTEALHKIMACVAYYDLLPNVVHSVDLTGKVNYIRLLYEFKKLQLDVNTIHCIKELLKLS